MLWRVVQLKGVIVKGGRGLGKDGKIDSVIVQFDLGRSETWVYDPAKGALTPGGTAKVDAAPPVPGIGIVIKKNPGGGSTMVVPVCDGGAAPFPKLDDGSYDVAIRVPNAAFAVRPKSGGDRGVELVFTVVKRGGDMLNVVVQKSDRGAGSPKQQGF